MKRGRSIRCKGYFTYKQTENKIYKMIREIETDWIFDDIKDLVLSFQM